MEFKIIFGIPLSLREFLNMDLFLFGFLVEVLDLTSEGEEIDGDEEDGGEEEEEEGISLRPSSSTSTSLSLSTIYSPDSISHTKDSPP